MIETIHERLERLGKEFQEARAGLQVSLSEFSQKGLIEKRISNSDFQAHTKSISDFADR